MKTAALFLLLTVTVSLVKGETPLPPITAENPVPTRIRSAVGAEGLVFEFPTEEGAEYRVLSSEDLITWDPAETTVRGFRQIEARPASSESGQVSGAEPISVTLHLRRISNTSSGLFLTWNSLATPGIQKYHTLKNVILAPDFPQTYTQISGDYRFHLTTERFVEATPGNAPLSFSDREMLLAFEQALISFNLQAPSNPNPVLPDPVNVGNTASRKFFKIEKTPSSSLDWDGDSVLNSTEIMFGSDPTNPDTDFDGMSDGMERTTAGRNFLSNELLGDPDFIPTGVRSGRLVHYDFESPQTLADGSQFFSNKASGTLRLFTSAVSDSSLSSKSVALSQFSHALVLEGSGLLSPLSSFSISMWFRMDEDVIQTRTGQAFFGVLGPINQPILNLTAVKGADNGQLVDVLSLFYQVTGGALTENRLPFDDMDDGKWHHLVLTKSDRYRIYLDDSQVLESAPVGQFIFPNTPNASTTVYFGARIVNDTSHGLRGNIDEILIHNRVLTSEEIQALAAKDKTDIDGDGISDSVEIANGLNPLVVDPPGAVAP